MKGWSNSTSRRNALLQFARPIFVRTGLAFSRAVDDQSSQDAYGIRWVLEDPCIYNLATLAVLLIDVLGLVGHTQHDTTSVGTESSRMGSAPQWRHPQTRSAVVDGEQGTSFHVVDVSSSALATVLTAASDKRS